MIYIQNSTYYCKFRHIQGYSCPTQTYSEFLYIQNPVIFRIQAHLEPEMYAESWAIRTLGCSEPEVYSESCQTSTIGGLCETAKGYNYFCNIRFLCPVVYEKKMIF